MSRTARAAPALCPPSRPGRAPTEGPRLPKALRSPRPPSKSGPPRGAPGFVVGCAQCCPPVRPHPPLSRTPAEAWDLVPASAVVSAHLEAAAPIYGWYPTEEEWTAPHHVPRQRWRALLQAGHDQAAREPRLDSLEQLPRPLSAPTEPLPRHSTARGGHRRRPPVCRLLAAS
jgi:hypothetical protein